VESASAALRIYRLENGKQGFNQIATPLFLRLAGERACAEANPTNCKALLSNIAQLFFPVFDRSD